MPFEFEGIGTHLQAADTFDRLRQVSDAVLETPGSGTSDGDRTLAAAMEQDRGYVASFASVVSSIIDAGTGQSTLTAAHLKSILHDGALTTFGTGEGFGLTGAVEAAEACAESALSNRPSTGAINRAVLLIESGPELSISHIATAMATIEARIGASVELQPGVRRSRLLAGKVRVSLVGSIQEVRRPLIHTSPGLLAGLASF
jgi:cell division GTPase FtsZ